MEEEFGPDNFVVVVRGLLEEAGEKEWGLGTCIVSGLVLGAFFSKAVGLCDPEITVAHIVEQTACHQKSTLPHAAAMRARQMCRVSG